MIISFLFHDSPLSFEITALIEYGSFLYPYVHRRLPFFNLITFGGCPKISIDSGLVQLNPALNDLDE